MRKSAVQLQRLHVPSRRHCFYLSRVNKWSCFKNENNNHFNDVIAISKRIGHTHYNNKLLGTLKIIYKVVNENEKEKTFDWLNPNKYNKLLDWNSLYWLPD